MVHKVYIIIISIALLKAQKISGDWDLAGYINYNFASFTVRCTDERKCQSARAVYRQQTTSLGFSRESICLRPSSRLVYEHQFGKIQDTDCIPFLATFIFMLEWQVLRVIFRVLINCVIYFFQVLEIPHIMIYQADSGHGRFGSGWFEPYHWMIRTAFLIDLDHVNSRNRPEYIHVNF